MTLTEERPLAIGAPAARKRPLLIKLCTVAGPMAIAQPRSPQLARFRFFLGRERENGQEQCWLQMGYFTQAEEANKWLSTLRRVYPDARVVEAPELRSESQPPFRQPRMALAVRPGPVATAEALDQPPPGVEIPTVYPPSNTPDGARVSWR